MNYTYSRFEEFVWKLYKYAGVSESKNINLKQFAAKFDIEVIYVEACTIYLDGVLFVNSKVTKEQQWQQFSHELCHALWHTGNQVIMQPMFRDLQEWQADNFMYHFCVPTFMLRKVRIPPDKREAIHLIAETFNVEYDFAAVRLDQYLRKLYVGRLATW